MRSLFYTIIFLMLCGNSFSQNCTITVYSKQVFINNHLITFTSLGEFKKLLGGPDSINHGIAFANRQLEILKVESKSGKPVTEEYGIEISFDKNNNGFLNNSKYPAISCFTGTLILNGDTLTNQSHYEKFTKLKGWKLEKKAKNDTWSSYVLYNKSLEILVGFENDLLVSFSLVPAKGY